MDSIPKSKKSYRRQTQYGNGHHRQSGAADAMLQKPHVAMIIPRGEVVRNFFYTGCLDQIAQEAKISLLTVSPSPEFDNLFREKFGDVFTLKEVEENWAVRFQREMLDIAHGKWLWSRAAERRWKIRDTEAKTTRARFKRAVKKSVSLPFANQFGLNILSKTERASSRILRSTDEYLNLFQKIKPTLVFNGSHIHSRNAIQAVQAAQWLGIPTATFIFSWDNLTSQGRITLPYDYFLVWNEALKNQLVQMYDWIDPDNVFVTGTPQFDFHFRPEFYLSRDEFCSSVVADSQRPILFYATGMPNHMPGEPEIVEGIADMLEQFDPENRPQLLVRVYAKDLSGRFEEMKKRRTDILFPDVAWEPAWLTPKYEDSYSLVNTLRHCALGVNVASTISLELCMFDKPVINVGYNPESVSKEELSYADYYEFEHYKPVVESGAVQVALDKEQMNLLIKESLNSPEKRRRERKDLIDRMFASTLDGNSGKRVAEVLLQIARGNE